MNADKYIISMQMNKLGYLLFYLKNPITLTYIADRYIETTFYYLST